MSLETMSLETTPATDLDSFIERHLLPDTAFRTQVKGAIDIICTFLKEKCFEGQDQVWVSKVVKGGSSGKGTALRDTSDADLVVFLSPLTSFQEQFRRREEFLREIRRQLEACQTQTTFTVNFEVQKPGVQNPRALGFTLKSPSLPGAAVEFDVLPAYDVLGQVTKDYRPSPDVYVKLIRECKVLKKEGEFSSCFTELQRAFLKQRPAKLKSLLRLVKHWYQKCKEKVAGRLPPKYALELLTVYAWEQAGQPEDFNTAQGFRTVLELIMRRRRLCIYWTQYYDLSHPVIGPYLQRQFKKPRPVILDPADPTKNVGGEHRKGWKLLAREAGAWLMYQCFHNGNGSSVGSWDIRACGGGGNARGTSALKTRQLPDCGQHPGPPTAAFPGQSHHRPSPAPLPTPPMEENRTHTHPSPFRRKPANQSAGPRLTQGRSQTPGQSPLE